MSKLTKGQQRISEILGAKSKDILDLFQSISPDFVKYVLEFGYGDLYTRENFSDKSRELAAVACLMGQGNTSTALHAHLQGMLNVGWTKEEILELLLFLVGYVGFPTCAETIKIFRNILLEQ